MKILLLHEFSALHKYLKEGLLELGHNVTLIANGDSWKQIDGADRPIYKIKGNNPITKFWGYVVTPFFSLNKLPEYDVFQLMNSDAFFALFNTAMVKMLAKKAKVFSLLAAGDDYTVLDAYNQHFLEYYVYDFDKSIFQYYDEKKKIGAMRIKNHKKIVNMASVVIPCAYEYEMAYKNYHNIYKSIPFPINVDNIRYEENVVGEKIIFFHGLNRELGKGTPFIRAALDKLKNKYPNDVEVIIDGHMPYNKYLDVVKKANVIIDQCVGYSYGMTSCIAMAQGKVVMAGNHPEMQRALGIKPPIVWVKPDVEHIYSQLEKIVEKRSSIPEIGYKSRKFVEEHHHYVNIAQQYIDAWKLTGKL